MNVRSRLLLILLAIFLSYSSTALGQLIGSQNLTAGFSAVEAEELSDAPSTFIAPEALPLFESTAVDTAQVNEQFRFNLIESARPRGEYQSQFRYREALRESTWFLSAQHGLRLLQPKTRREIGGPFFRDWFDSVGGIQGWGDGDGPVTNYLLHPGEGAVASFIFIQNSPVARAQEFDLRSSRYWTSRLKAMAFAAAYSTQFEIGPYSEATIGNVGLRPGSSGYVDFVMTPVGGFGLTVLEDWLDAKYIEPREDEISAARRRFLRIVMNPNRSIANLLRRRTPWYRENR